MRDRCESCHVVGYIKHVSRVGKSFQFFKCSTGQSKCGGRQSCLHGKHLVVCGVLQKSSETWEIIAYCVQTSAINKDPHEIKGNLNIRGSVVDIGILVCSCKAGISGCCKHIAATLLFCTRLYRNLCYHA